MTVPTPDKLRTHGLPTIRASLFAILLFQVCALFLRSYAQSKLAGVGVSPDDARELSWLVVPVILGVLMLPIFRDNWRSLLAMLSWSGFRWAMAGYAIALACALRLAFFSINALLSGTGWLEFHPDHYLITDLPQFSCPPLPSLLLAVVVSALLTPFVEELVHRGLTLTLLVKHGRWFAVVASSILFGLYHIPRMIIPAAIIGVFLALLYMNRGVLWGAIIAHGTYNGLTIIDRQCLQFAWNSPLGIPDSPATNLLLVLTTACGFLAAIACLRRYRAIENQGRGAPLAGAG